MGTEARITLRLTDKTKAGWKAARQNIAAVSGAVFKLKNLAVGAAGLGGFGYLVQQQLASVDAMAKTADRLNLNTEALAGYRLAAREGGVETNTFDMALQRFTRRAAEAKLGTGEAKDALKQLGITLSDSEGKLRPTEALLLDVADAFKRIEDPSERVRLAFKLFDSEGVKMVNTLSQGREAFTDATDRARDYGTAIDRIDAAQVEQANNSLARGQEALKGIATRASVELAPAITLVADKFSEMVGDSHGFETFMAEVSFGAQMFAGYIIDGLNRIQFWKAQNQKEDLVKLLDPQAKADAIAAVRELEAEHKRYSERVNEFAEAGRALPGAIVIKRDQTRDALMEAREHLVDVAHAAEDYLKNQREIAQLNADLGKGGVGILAEQMEEARKRAEAAAAAAKGTGGGDPLLTGAPGPTQQQLDAKLAQMQQYYQTDQQLAEQAFIKKQEVLTELRENGRISDLEWFEGTLQLEQEKQDKLTAIKEAAELRRLGITTRAAKSNYDLWQEGWQGQLQVAGNFFGQMEGLMKSRNKTMFRIGQAAAIARTIISTITGAQDAYSAFSWIPIVGPALGTAAMAATLVTGFANVKRIASQKPDGGGSSVGAQVPSLPSAPAGAAANPVSAPTLGGDINAPRRTANIIINSEGGFIPVSKLPEVFEQFNGFIDDGGTLNINVAGDIG